MVSEPVVGWLVALLLLIVRSAAQQPAFDPGVAAEVMRGTVTARAADAMQDNQQLLLDYQSAALEQELAQEAVKRGLAERMDVQQELQKARRQTLVRAVRDDVARAVAAPSEEELKQAYQSDPGRWTLPAAYQLDVFLVAPGDTNGLAQARQLAAGKAVPDDALRFLNARALVLQSSGRWLEARDVVPAIWTNLPAMKAGEGRLFDTDGGLLFVRRGAFREQKTPPFEQVRGQIQAALHRQKQAEAWRDYLIQKRKELGF
jgi:hypothetical protein